MKKRSGLLFVLVVALFIASCTPEPEISDEQLLEDLEELSDEEVDAALAEPPLAGEAYQATPYQISPQRQSSVQNVSKNVKSAGLTFTSCTDSDGGQKYSVAGEVVQEYVLKGKTVRKTYPDVCDGQNITEFSCEGNRFKRTTLECPLGCTHGSCASDGTSLVPQDTIIAAKDDPLLKLKKTEEYKYVHIFIAGEEPSFDEDDKKKIPLKIYPFPRWYQPKDYQPPETETFPLSLSRWEHFGLKGTGVITSIDYFRQNANILLMGTEGSGLYQSNNFGGTWYKLDFPLVHIDRVAIDPNDASHYLVLTNIVDLFESRDTGRTWNRVYQFSGYTGFTNLVWNGDKVLVSVHNQMVMSADNGNTWRRQHTLPDLGYISDVKIKSMGVGAFSGYRNGAYQLFLTTDYGENWRVILDGIQIDQEAIIYAFDISIDGRKIVVLASSYRSSLGGKIFTLVTSLDGGNHWQFRDLETVPFNRFGGQDLIIDESDENYISLFLYMGGLYESADAGRTFVRAPVSQRDVVDLPSPEGFVNLIEPEDLFFGDMHYLTAPTTGMKVYLLPTDQGLFLYDTTSDSVKNIVKDLYLSDSGRVTVSPCPRIYSGLWHAGYFVVNPNGSIFGNAVREVSGASIGKDLGCETPVLYNSGQYLHNGVESSPYYEEGQRIYRSGWFWDNVLLQMADFTTAPNGKLYLYHDGWWYGYGHMRDTGIPSLGRFDFNEFQIMKTHPEDIESFFIEEKRAEAIFWLLDKNALWRSTDLERWSLYKNLSILKGLYNSRAVLKNFLMTSYPLLGAELFVKDNFILISGRGLFVSQDGGEQWDVFFPSAWSSHVVRDAFGKLFIGLQPFKNERHWLEENVTGVWMSEDNGRSWQRFGEGAEKSWVSGLALSNEGDALYAATRGESLLKIRLE